MTILEALVTSIVLVACGYGVYWLFKDIQKMIDNEELAEAERCESLDEDEE